MASSAPPLEDAHLLSQPRSAQDLTLPQAPVPFTGIPSLTVTIPPTPTLASSAPPLEDAQDLTQPQEPVPFTGISSLTVAMPPQAPAPILASSVPPLEGPSVQVTPVPSMTGITAMTPPASVLAPGVPPLDSSDPLVPSAGESEQRFYKKGKMRPGSSLTARYIYSLIHYWLLALIPLFRNLCAIDWCVKHPDGTAAEFKQYYDHEMSNEDKKVCLIHSNVQINAS